MPADWQLPPGVTRNLWDSFHDAAVARNYDAQLADTGARQDFGLRRSKRTATDNYGSSSGETTLSFFTYPGEKNLSAVSIRMRLWFQVR